MYSATLLKFSKLIAMNSLVSRRTPQPFAADLGISAVYGSISWGFAREIIFVITRTFPPAPRGELNLAVYLTNPTSASYFSFSSTATLNCVDAISSSSAYFTRDYASSSWCVCIIKLFPRLPVCGMFVYVPLFVSTASLKKANK